jgi:hypothetical protein
VREEFHVCCVFLLSFPSFFCPDLNEILAQKSVAPYVATQLATVMSCLRRMWRDGTECNFRMVGVGATLRNRPESVYTDGIRPGSGDLSVLGIVMAGGLYGQRA